MLGDVSSRRDLVRVGSVAEHSALIVEPDLLHGEVAVPLNEASFNLKEEAGQIFTDIFCSDFRFLYDNSFKELALGKNIQH